MPKAINADVLNSKLFRKLRVKTNTYIGPDGKSYVENITIAFPARGPHSKLSKKQIEPLRKDLERDFRVWQRILAGSGN